MLLSLAAVVAAARSAAPRRDRPLGPRARSWSRRARSRPTAPPSPRRSPATGATSSSRPRTQPLPRRTSPIHRASPVRAGSSARISPPARSSTSPAGTSCPQSSGAPRSARQFPSISADGRFVVLPHGARSWPMSTRTPSSTSTGATCRSRTTTRPRSGWCRPSTTATSRPRTAAAWWSGPTLGAGTALSADGNKVLFRTRRTPTSPARHGGRQPVRPRRRGAHDDARDGKLGDRAPRRAAQAPEQP